MTVKGYFDAFERNRLKKVLLGYLLGLHFGALKAAGWKEEGSSESICHSRDLCCELVLQYVCGGLGGQD